MKERNNKMELLGNAPIPKALMALGIPIMIGMLINALYNLVDAYFVGGLGESQMGAISIVFPLGQVVVGLGLMFGNGAASYLSRLLGRGDKDTANKVASTALYSSVLVGAIIIILATIFLKPILTLLGATDTIMPYALTYARIYVVSCIFNVFNVTMNNIVTSEGAAKTTMCAFYIFPDVREFGMSSEEFAVDLLKEEKVAVVPGSAFGDSGEGFIRISYAYSIAELKEALLRIERYIQRKRKELA